MIILLFPEAGVSMQTHRFAIRPPRTRISVGMRCVLQHVRYPVSLSPGRPRMTNTKNPDRPNAQPENEVSTDAGMTYRCDAPRSKPAP
jgi:hypothetical protein